MEEHQSDKNWRNSWAVESFLAPLPVVGPFFGKMGNPLYLAGKQLAMILGGTIIMMLNPTGTKPGMSSTRRYVGGAGNMFLGMGIAAVFYDTAIATAKHCKKKLNSTDANDKYQKLIN